MRLSERQSSALWAIASAFLFGCGVPAAKFLVGQLPQICVGCVWFWVSGTGLTCILLVKYVLRSVSANKPEEAVGINAEAHAKQSAIGSSAEQSEFTHEQSKGGAANSARKSNLLWLMSSTLIGGVLAPVSLTMAMTQAKASSVALLLNLEIVFTVLIATFYFGERLTQRELIGVCLITAGGVSLSWGGSLELCWALLFAAGAAFGWAIDSNLTARIAHLEPMSIARFKGLVAGFINVLLALALGARCSNIGIIGGALLTGLLCYGLSLSAFIFSLRSLGAARAVAFFALEPFIGSVLSLIVLKEALSLNLVVAGVLMGIGVFLHLTEPHQKSSA